MSKYFSMVVLLLGVFFSVAQVRSEQKIVCEDGICRIEDMPSEDDASLTQTVMPSRIAHGYMSEREFLDFLSGKERKGIFGDLSGKGIAVVLLIALLGGLAMNLTPCVLPMVPVTLMVIGKSARRGAAYALGMMIAYGAMGVAAALGSTAFGAIQGNAWFNLAVAAIFAVLGLSLAGLFPIDLSRSRAAVSGPRQLGDFYALFMGALSAVLAGACVAPVLIAVLLFTADLYAKGEIFALALPFIMGLGMALPWPFAGAGMKVLPKPGAWMKWVNRSFAVIVLLLAVWYALQAYRGFGGSRASVAGGEGYLAVTCDDFKFDTLKRPVLVDCWASWCKNCAAMDTVLSRPAVAAELRKFTFVKLQAEDISKLVALPGFAGVKGLPAFVVFE